MKKLNCKIIVSDFDGTLANSKNEVPPEVVSAINGYVADGGIFAVCSGRILPSILPRVRQIGLKGLVIACQGSVIADIETGKIIRSVYFSTEEVTEICTVFEEMNLNVQVYHDNGFFSDLPEGEKHLALYESIIGVTAKHADEPLSKLTHKSLYKFNKVLTLCREEDREALYEELCRRFAGRYDVTCSAKVLIEISPLNETKGKALRFLCSHYGVPLSEACAIGDNLNDLSMVEIAGHGVAVGNAAQGLKAAARHVTVSCDDGAVKKVIEELGYCND